jgi:hypothetical protein
MLPVWFRHVLRRWFSLLPGGVSCLRYGKSAVHEQFVDKKIHTVLYVGANAGDARHRKRDFCLKSSPKRRKEFRDEMCFLSCARTIWTHACLNLSKTKTYISNAFRFFRTLLYFHSRFSDFRAYFPWTKCRLSLRLSFEPLTLCNQAGMARYFSGPQIFIFSGMDEVFGNCACTFKFDSLVWGRQPPSLEKKWLQDIQANSSHQLRSFASNWLDVSTSLLASTWANN